MGLDGDPCDPKGSLSSQWDFDQCRILSAVSEPFSISERVMASIISFFMQANEKDKTVEVTVGKVKARVINRQLLWITNYRTADARRQRQGHIFIGLPRSLWGY